jgi:hypothetical protein
MTMTPQNPSLEGGKVNVRDSGLANLVLVLAVDYGLTFGCTRM